MRSCTEQNGAISFAVRVIVRASRSEIAGEHDGILRVRLSAPPVDGAANAELVRLLAKAFGVSVRQVEITNGHQSKTKTVRVTGVERADYERLTKRA